MDKSSKPVSEQKLQFLFYFQNFQSIQRRFVLVQGIFKIVLSDSCVCLVTFPYNIIVNINVQFCLIFIPVFYILNRLKGLSRTSQFFKHMLIHTKGRG